MRIQNFTEMIFPLSLLQTNLPSLHLLIQEKRAPQSSKNKKMKIFTKMTSKILSVQVMILKKSIRSLKREAESVMMRKRLKRKARKKLKKSIIMMKRRITMIITKTTRVRFKSQ